MYKKLDFSIQRSEKIKELWNRCSTVNHKGKILPYASRIIRITGCLISGIRARPEVVLEHDAARTRRVRCIVPWQPDLSSAVAAATEGGGLRPRPEGGPPPKAGRPAL
jgi:hypothetical protein